MDAVCPFSYPIGLVCLTSLDQEIILSGPSELTEWSSNVSYFGGKRLMEVNQLLEQTINKQ